MKKLIALTLIAAITLTMLIPVWAVGMGDSPLLSDFSSGLPELVNGAYYVFTVKDDETAVINSVDIGLSGEVAIPAVISGYTVTEIGRDAFHGYTGITSITVPTTVTAIGDFAFAGCTDLESVNLGRVESLGYGVFDGDTEITTLELPDTLSHIESTFGAMTSLESITVAEGNEWFTVVDGVLFDASVSQLVAYPAKRGGGVYVVPNSVSSIQPMAFACTYDLMSIILPEGLSYMCETCFAYAYGLTGVYFKGEPCFNGESCFTSDDDGDGNYTICNESLTIYALDTVSAWNDFTYEENGVTIPIVRYNLSNLDNLTGSGFTYSVLDESAKTAAITGYNGAGGAVSIPSAIDGYTVTTINSAALQDNETITSIAIPSSVTYIQPFSLGSIGNLTEITIDAANETYKSVAGVVYTSDGKTLVVYPAGKSDRDYHIEAGCVTIASHAFFGAYKLARVFCPSSVATISERAFQNCRNLHGVYFEDGENYIHPMNIDTQAFRSFQNNENDSEGFFFDVSYQVVFYIYDMFGIENEDTSAGWIRDNWQTYSGVTYPCAPYTNYDDNYTYYYEDDGSRLILTGCVDAIDSEGEYTFPRSIEFSDGTFQAVDSIGFFALRSYDNIYSVSIPNTVKTLKYSALSDMHSLGSVSFEWNSELETIERAAFRWCTNLSDVEIPAGVTNMRAPFEGCQRLTSYQVNGNNLTFRNDENGVIYGTDKAIFGDLDSALSWLGNSETAVTAADGEENISCDIEGSENEGIGNLFDGDVGTKYCSTGSGEHNITWNYASAITPTAIIFATADDNATYINRNPQRWELYGSNDNGNWTQIISGSENDFVELNHKYIAIPIDNGGSYQYYKLTATSNDNANMQLAEVVLCEETVSREYSGGDKILIEYPEGKTLTSFNIADDTKVIGFYAFTANNYLRDVTVPATVNAIEPCAFTDLAASANGNLTVRFRGDKPDIDPSAFLTDADVARVTVTYVSGSNWSDGVYIINGIAYNATCNESTFYRDGFEYTVDGDSNATIVKFTGSGNVTIPVSLNGDAIVAINADAFASCENITSFSSENSRWYANDSALYTLDGDGIGDTLVAYPSGVWSPAFIMPEGVDKIAPYAFANATQLESVVFPDNITSIGAYAFKNSYVSNNGNDDENYLLFVIGGSVDSIDDNAFTGMNVMPYILCAGGCNSFDGMPGITLTNEREVDIPVEKLGIENDVLYRINDDAAEIVAYIGRDSDVITPNKLGGYTVKSIGFAAYQNFDCIQSLTVSEDIEQISSCAFRFCSSLTTLVLPSTLNNIDPYAFQMVPVSNASFNNGENYNGYWFDDDKPVLYREDGNSYDLCYIFAGYADSDYSVRYDADRALIVRENAFEGSYTLNKITFFNNLEAIRTNAFSSCAGMTLEFMGSRPAIDIAPFDCSPDDITLRVRECYADSWKISEDSCIYDDFNACFYRCEIDTPAEWDWYVDNDKAVIVFYNDTAADITVPDTLTDGEGVEYTVTQVINTTFSRNTAIETITFPAAVTNIDRYVFNSCSSLKAVYIDDENTKYYDDDGVLYYKNSSDEDVLMYYPVAKNDPIIYVKDGTEIIGQDAIIAPNSGAIVLPTGVTALENNAIMGLIHAAYFRGDKPTLGNDAINFWRGGYIAYEEGTSGWDFNTTDNSGRKYETFWFRAVTIGEAEKYFILPYGNNGNDHEDCCISEYLDFTSESVDIAANLGGNYTVTEIKNAFTNNSALTSVTLPASVNWINEGAFSDSPNITEFVMDGSGSYCVIGGVLYHCTEDGLELHTYPEGKTETSFRMNSMTTGVCFRAFNNTTRLTDIYVPARVMNFNDSAFSCWDTGDLTLHFEGDAPAYISEYAFESDNLPTLEYCEGSEGWDTPQWTYHGYYEEDDYSYELTFNTTVNTTQTSGDFLYEINDDEANTVYIVGYTGDDEFMNVPAEINGMKVKYIYSGSYNYFTGMNIPDGVIYFDKTIFCDDFREVTVDNNNTNFKSVDGVVYSKDGTELIYFPIKKGDMFTFTVPDGVTTICTDAFASNKSLETLVLPASLTKIESGAFNNAARWIDEDTKEMISLRLICAGSPFTADSGAFDACGNVEIIYRSSLSSEFDAVAYTYSDDTSVTKTAYTDSGNYMIKEFNNGDGTTSWGVYRYIGYGETEVEIPSTYGDNTIKIIDGKAFEGSTISSVTLPDNCEAVKDCAFRNSLSLTSVTFNDVLKEIEAEAFANTALDTVTLPAEIEYINTEAFNGTQITEYNIPRDGNGDIIGSYYTEDGILYHIEDDCVKLFLYPVGSDAYDVHIPDDVTAIAYRAFCDANNLVEVYLPYSITSLEFISFGYCNSLEFIRFSGDRPLIDQGAFEGTDTERLMLYYDYNGSNGWSTPYVYDNNGNQYNAQAVNVGNIDDDYFYFTDVENSTVTIVRYAGEAKDDDVEGRVRIPSQINDMTVTSINDRAFGSNDTITEVIIPATVTQIGNTAFDGANNIKSYAVDEGNDCFYTVDDILYEREFVEDRTEITLKRYPAAKQNAYFYDTENVCRIVNSAFNGVRTIKNFEFQDNLSHIWSYAFNMSEPIESITFNGNPPRIEEDAFETLSDNFCFYVPDNGSWTFPTYTAESGDEYNTRLKNFALTATGGDTVLVGDSYTLRLTVSDIKTATFGGAIYLNFDPEAFEFDSVTLINPLSETWEARRFASNLEAGKLEIDVYDDEFVDTAKEGDTIAVDVVFRAIGTTSGGDKAAFTVTEYEFMDENSHSIFGIGGETSVTVVDVFELEQDNKYTIETDNNTRYVADVHDETGVTTFLEAFTNSESMRVVKADETTVLTNADKVGTGCILQYLSGDEVVQSIEIIVKGDTTGDGEINATDYGVVKAAAMGNTTLVGAYLKAADTTGDGRLNAVDYGQVKRYAKNAYDWYE